MLQKFDEKFFVSYGLIDNISKEKEYSFTHLCSTKYGSNGCPIINLSTCKLIGINVENKDENINEGNFIKFALEEFVEKKFYNRMLFKEFARKYNLNIIIK